MTIRPGQHRVSLEVPETVPIGHAVTQLWAYLGEKDSRIARQWPKARLREFIIGNLKRKGQPEDFLSRENFLKTQTSFGTMFRAPGEKVARVKLKPDNLFVLDPMAMPAQSVSEDQLRNDSVVFYTDDAEAGFKDPRDKALWKDWQNKRAAAKLVDVEEIACFPKALQPVAVDGFKCPTNLLVARYAPERKFATALFAHAELFDAFFKNADMGFFKFPYSFKSAIHAKTHAKTEAFNPDFILKLTDRDVVLVVEIKNDDDDSARNKAKLRDAKEHFKRLNKKLEQTGERWRYRFYFLSPADYATFFQAVRENRLEYVSSLMNELSQPAGD